MRAQFEEKIYEQHLSSRLVGSRPLFFPPGQVLEGVLGFDVALWTSSSVFWRNFRHLYPWWHMHWLRALPGAILDPGWWQDLEERTEHLPRFKFNCFIQAKRPERMVRATAAEYHHWGRRYFRYDTFASQQAALAKLAGLTKNKAIVTYACPAFHRYKELWAAVKRGTLVEESNFCEVQKLNDHERFSFVSAGNEGMAHSEPELIESVAFEAALDRLQELEVEKSSSNVGFLVEVGKNLDEASIEMGRLQQIYDEIVDTLFEGSDSRLSAALARILAFQFVGNVRMLIGYEG